MKKLLTITILLTTLISCSQGIEEYSCSFMEQDKTKIYTHYFTFDTKNDLWNSDGDWSFKEQQGRISQKNDYFYELSVRDFLWQKEYAYYVFDRKKKKLYDARRFLEALDDVPASYIGTPIENLDIAYFTFYYNEDEEYFNCK